MGGKDGDKKKKISREEWKKKYGSDTHYYTHNLNKVDLTTGKTVSQIIQEVSKKYKIDPSFLASTLMTEGLDRYDIYNEKSNPFKREDYNSHPVSGMKHLGLDTIGNRKAELIRKGLVSKEEYEREVLEVNTLNEKNEKVTSADFSDLQAGVKYVAAFIKMETENVDKYVEQQGINLTPLQRTFFRNVAYNAGIGNAQKMISSYNGKGYLKDDAFIFEKPDKYWEGVYKHAHKRTTAGMGLAENTGFESPNTENNIYQPQVLDQNRKKIKALSTIQPGNVEPLKATPEEVNRIPAKGLAANGLQGKVKIDNTISAEQGVDSSSLKPRKKLQALGFDPSAPSTVITVKGGNGVDESSLNPRKKLSPIEMKKNSPYPLDPAIEEKIISNLAIGIAGVESKKDGYKAVNKTSKALGKYQFVPKYWWGPIKKFADKNGYKINNHQDFLNSPSLQEAYFRHYVKEEILPQAQKAFDSGENPENLTLEEMTAMYHFQSPAVATKAIKEGKSAYRERTKAGVDGAKHDNAGMGEYLDVYNETLEANGIDKVPAEETLNPKSVEEVGKSYFNAVDNVQYMAGDLNEKEKNQRIQEIQSEYKKKGLIPAINKYVDKRNEENTKTYEAKNKAQKENLNNFLNYGEEIDFSFNKENGKMTFGNYNAGNDAAAKEFEKFAKANGIKVSKRGNFNYRVEPKEYMNAFKKEYSDKTGAELKGSQELKGNTFMNMAANLFGHSENSGTISFNDEVRSNITKPGEIPTIDNLDPELIPDIEDEQPTPEVGEITSEVVPEESDASSKEESEEPWMNPADTFFDGQKGLLSASEKALDKGSYNKDDFKKEIPFDAVTGLALGLIGREQARNAEIPLRTEEVSGMIDMYVSELAKRAKHGLPPEVEAAMKNQFAESFQAGLRSTVNASGGNRARVLGNQGQLSVAQNRGIVDAQMADFQAKEKAFEQYGRAIQYIDTANRNRDIANTQLKQQRGLMQERQGQQLAAAGFAKLTDELAYQRDNGPGSVNHMAKSAMMQRIFGFDPDMKDDGTGKPGTRSAYEAKKLKVAEAKKENEVYTEKYQGLTSDQRKEVGLFYEENPSKASMYGKIDSMYQPGLRGMNSPSAQAEEEKEKPNNDWMNNDFGYGISPDGSPAAPPDPVASTEYAMQSGAPKPQIAGTTEIPGLATPGIAGGDNIPETNAAAIALNQTEDQNPLAKGLMNYSNYMDNQ